MRLLEDYLFSPTLSAYGVSPETYPPSDMPKRPRRNRQKGEDKNIGCQVADIQVAWHRCSLDERERQIIVAHHGLGDSYRTCARYLGLSKGSWQRICEEAVGKMVNYLNGEEGE